MIEPEPLDPDEAEELLEEKFGETDREELPDDAREKKDEDEGSPERSLDGLETVVETTFILLFVGGLVFVSVSLLPVAIVLIPVGYGVWKKHKKSQHEETKRETLRTMMREYRIEGDPDQFVVREIDFEREHPRDRAYRKRYKLVLLQEFGNACCNCGAMQQGLDLDHFFLPKSRGGTFALWHRNGFWVNNAIPLCQSCNRSKGDEGHRSYFDEDTLIEIMRINQEMTRRLNNERFQEKGISEEGSSHLSDVDLPENVLEDPDVSVQRYFKKGYQYVRDTFVSSWELGSTTGKQVFTDAVKPACVWWLSCRLRDQIVMGLVAGSISFVILLYVFGT